MARRARQAQAILLGTRLGALVGSNLAGPVVGHPDPAEETAPGVALSVGVVLLLERPERLLVVCGEDP